MFSFAKKFLVRIFVSKKNSRQKFGHWQKSCKKVTFYRLSLGRYKHYIKVVSLKMSSRNVKCLREQWIFIQTTIIYNYHY